MFTRDAGGLAKSCQIDKLIHVAPLSRERADRRYARREAEIAQPVSIRSGRSHQDHGQGALAYMK